LEEIRDNQLVHFVTTCGPSNKIRLQWVCVVVWGSLWRLPALRIPFKPQIQHLVCFVQLELRKDPASQLHPTQRKPKHESSQHNYILQHNVYFNLLCIQRMFHNPPHGPIWLRNIVEGEHSNPVILEFSNISASSVAAALSNLAPPAAVHCTPHSVEQPLPHAGNHLSIVVDTFLIRRTL